MRRLLTLVFLSSALFAGAQEAAPPTGAGYDRIPVFGGALVRFVHASPNAGPARVVASSTIEGVEERHVVELDYMATTAYRELTEGSYDIAVHLMGADGDAVVSERFDAVPGGVYTVAVVGLTLDAPAGEEEAGDGVWAWIRDLFTRDRPELALRPLILDDVGGATFGPDAPAYRIVHAAPGTDAVDLAYVREDGADVLATVSYLDTSGFFDVQPSEAQLEVRAAGTTATIATLTDVEQAPGLIHTVFVVGTPIEEVPLETVALTAEWAELGPVAPGVVGTRGVAGLMSMSEVNGLRQLLIAMGDRVDAAQRDLEDAGTEAEGPVADARRELEEAMQLLAQAHRVLDEAERRVP